MALNLEMSMRFLPFAWGNRKCGSNFSTCTCTNISIGLTSYAFHSTGETRSITHHIDGNSKSLIYMIKCKRCYKQCTEEEHRRPVNQLNNILKPTTVSEYFLTYHHIANDISLIPLQPIHSNRDSVCKAREAYLIRIDATHFDL